MTVRSLPCRDRGRSIASSHSGTAYSLSRTPSSFAKVQQRSRKASVATPRAVADDVEERRREAEIPGSFRRPSQGGVLVRFDFALSDFAPSCFRMSVQ